MMGKSGSEQSTLLRSLNLLKLPTWGRLQPARHISSIARMSLPLLRLQPWWAWAGRDGGARAALLADPVVEIEQTTVAYLIYYEQLIVWPWPQSSLSLMV
ncbi:hypothetical protein [Agrobacterium sp. OT33]|uniref:hypothetical protein n=1 Tax=Agrobacterium sp. OT33 TaxID=2815338 RepID=UPI001A8FA144|nr:hypothetical protein [Agrobacterium sp. OT33]MBO0128359.1 hypothetical protein [Agrobacterium sp. OT33]